MRELSDQEMLQFMARENQEDYNANFLVMLETWEAAVKYCAEQQKDIIVSQFQGIDIAKFLGWTTETWRAKQSQPDVALNLLSQACNSAYNLLQGGYISHADLDGLSVRAVGELCGALAGKLKLTETAKAQRNVTGHTLVHINRAEQITVDSARRVAELVRRGEVAVVWIRQEMESDAYKRARAAKVKHISFEVFAKDLADSIERMLRKDSAAEKPPEVLEAMKHITEEPDARAVRRIKYELSELEDTARRWRRKLTPANEKVVSLSKQLGKPAPEDNDLLPAPSRLVKKPGDNV